MHPPDLCLDQAEICELRAAEQLSQEERDEWRLMAEEWHLASALPFTRQKPKPGRW